MLRFDSIKINCRAYQSKNRLDVTPFAIVLRFFCNSKKLFEFGESLRVETRQELPKTKRGFSRVCKTFFILNFSLYFDMSLAH
jgi:hypothetical protein